MLTHLNIQNYALISHLDIDFQSGFSTLTGETGAGKSIILGALNLVMGARTDTKTITDGEQRCQIEAVFVTDTDGEMVIRRELNVNGRSRSFVNDELITAAELKDLSKKLIDIHSQHENLLLGDDTFQIQVVDAIAGNTTERDVYQTAYEAHERAVTALRKMEADARKSAGEADYMAFQYQQLSDARLTKGEWQPLQEEAYRLAHAEQIRQALAETAERLKTDNGILSMLHDCRLGEAASDLEERLRSAEIELKDIAAEAAHKAEQTEMNDERLAEVEQRLDLLQTLMAKHHVNTVEELIDLRNQWGEALQKIDSYDDEIQRLQQEEAHTSQVMAEAATKLHQTRVAVTDTIAQQLMTDMKNLGVIHAHVAVQVNDADEYTVYGKDDVQFMFAANLNQSLRRVSEVASGGEIARLMLCVKALIASTNGLPTIIFDEIDTGVSGEVASQMGSIMRQMAANRQIIAITHLPQIAAKADVQYRVYKEDTLLRTETHIERLSASQRVQEIASMLSGHHPTKEALATAQQLLGA